MSRALKAISSSVVRVPHHHPKDDECFLLSLIEEVSLVLSFVRVVKIYLYFLLSAKKNKQTQEKNDGTEGKTILALLCSLSPKI